MILNRFQIKKLLVLFFIIPVANTVLWAQNDIQIEEILIQDEREETTLQSVVISDDITQWAPHDIGGVFEHQAGFDVVKRGGFAMEPVLRSFKYEQLNFQYDGNMQVVNACPNRMDPITVHVMPEEIEKIEIIKGPYSVRFGQSMGGIINVITQRAEKNTTTSSFSGLLEGGYHFNGQGKYTRVAAGYSRPRFDVLLNGGLKDFENYESGNGTEIPSAFRTYDYSVKAGVNITNNERIQLTWRQAFTYDVLHAGLPMDADEDNSSVLSLDYAIRQLTPVFYGLNVKLYGSTVDHVMSNARRPNYAMVHAVSTVESGTLGGKLETVWRPATKHVIYTGFDFRYVGKDGFREREIFINPCTQMEMNPPKLFEDKVWQSSENLNAGAFAEWHHSAENGLLFIAGMRADWVNSAINAPAADFAAYYSESGVTPDSELNISATASLNWPLGNGWQLGWAVGRGSRAPNLAERYINHFTIGKDAHEYVGNPLLKSEINNQTDISFEKSGDSYRVFADVFYSYLTNYITAAVDSGLPRKYLPCQEPEFAKRFQNIDEAVLYGAEAGFEIAIINRWFLETNAAYTSSHNIDWDEPLPEVPPLAANVALKYKTAQLRSELRGHFVAAQNRVAASFNESESKAFNVFDFTISYAPVKWLEIRAGVVNIFDTNYYRHLSRAYKNMPETGLFYETGRSFNLAFKIHFN